MSAERRRARKARQRTKAKETCPGCGARGRGRHVEGCTFAPVKIGRREK